MKKDFGTVQFTVNQYPPMPHSCCCRQVKLTHAWNIVCTSVPQCTSNPTRAGSTAGN